MKLTIQNLGAIQKAEIDLKPLTILIGPNNAGKTWITYTLAGIFGPHGWGEYTDAYAAGELEEKYPPLDAVIEKVLTEGRASLNLVEFAEQHGERYFQATANYARQWMSDFMSTQLAAFDQMKVSIELVESIPYLLEQVKQSSFQLEVGGGAFKISKKRGVSTLLAYTSIKKADNGEDVTEPIPSEEITESLIDTVLSLIHRSLFSNVRAFPTERTALVTARLSSPTVPSRSVPNEKMQEVLDAVRNALEQVQIPLEMKFDATPRVVPKQAIGPVGHFVEMLHAIMNIGSKKTAKREREARNNPQIRKYQELAQVLEEQILAGSLRFSTPEPDPRRELLFHPQQGVALEIPIVSSMVKELAVLVLYLRYLAQPDELLVIDEPEMNLHPEAQAQMIEFLCLLVNAGLRVLVTTHSTYVVDHLTNLIYAAQLETERRKAATKIFFLEDENAFISQDKVSVYCVDNGTAENILREKGRMDWNTFSDVSDQIANIHAAM